MKKRCKDILPIHSVATIEDVVVKIFDGPRRVQFAPQGAAYIRLGDLVAGEIYMSPNAYIQEFNIDKRFFLQEGDVLVTKTGDDLRSAVVSPEVIGAVIAPDIYCLRPKPGSYSSIWLSYYLNTSYGQCQLAERSNGGKIRRLRLTDIGSIDIVYPPSELVIEVETLEQQAQVHTQTAHKIWEAILTGMYAEIDERSGLNGDANADSIEDFLSTPTAQKVFRSLGEVARIAVSSRKTLKPDQLVSYVQASDIDPQSFLFRRLRSALAQDLPSRIRLPLQAYQVLLLASGSNLGTLAHPVAVVDAKLDGGFASNAFLALDFHETPIYFAIALKYPLVLAQIRRMAVGPVVSTLRRKDIVHLRLPLLSAVWRQDFNDRAQLAWERRTLALTLRRRALDKAEAFIAQALAGSAV